jgi:tRNA threonylcarbamoyladenosine biosynthesis protein TsaE
MEHLGPKDFTEDELVKWGRNLGAAIDPPLWIALRGPLGAGKSVLARAICRGAGIEGNIPSPSFTLVQRYESPRGFNVYHVDLFRLRPGDPMEPLGWEELMGDPGLILLEWADRAADMQPEDRWEVNIDYAEGADRRVVKVSRVGRAPGLRSW